MKKILIFTGYYLPGYKAGGPIRSIANMVEELRNDYEFYIITSDRDLCDKTSYNNVNMETWNKIENAYTYYLTPENQSLEKIAQLMNSIDYNLLYLNSCFSLKFTIYPLLCIKFKLAKSVPVIIAPRGEFSKGALQIKKYKKKIFLAVSKILGLYKNCIWQATSITEKQDIKRIFGENIKLFLAPNISYNNKNLIYSKCIEKEKGNLRIIFVSRITRKKNLIMALKIIRNLTGNISFDIFGPIEDELYWNECQKLINIMPNNIKVNYCGAVKHDKIISLMNNYHIFLFPTLGENFGHVIIEALLGGCPVIISDRTPWRKLHENGAGYEISLDRIDLFTNTIQKFVDMDENEYNNYSRRAYEYGRKIIEETRAVQQHKLMFDSVLK
ncbi:glycosyltransferase family 4 protein [Thermosediminibacter litoriperuensis]|uniref:Glycosyltransferase involved in cell wall biosynthesis n=1 Tax=Thermosediminibacter litoriperuensis TaxID=291989 RepID=A0A5S5AM50_9FIRM|nr:glycosyltransferase [Thermosediminibacter litoriperuensis]TYP52410.1 glycosyltransferase involved in cell wall biosynthesis [Thermosediminibacter litoriperuensis]